MAPVGHDDYSSGLTLFNSALETGVRALFVLNAVYPVGFDLLRLTWFDHLVVHTGDVGGPESLHPAVPHRSGELLVRRRLIEESLLLMRRLHLVEVVANEAGIQYRASEEASSFIELMRSKYARTLKERAEWLASHMCGLEPTRLNAVIEERIGRWTLEFQSEVGPGRDGRGIS